MAKGVYIHIPFCVKKCSYCDLYSVTFDDDLKKRYLNALMREPVDAGYEGQVDTVYLGGGTPSLLSPSDIEGIIEGLDRIFGITSGAEITIEVNPGTVDEQKVRGYRAVGVNRVSAGVQSLVREELEVLGRIHTVGDVHRTLKLIGRFFDNYSVDIIYGIPGQGVSDLGYTIAGVAEYSCPHISAYELTIEDYTPLSSMLLSGRVKLPEEDKRIKMYRLLFETLTSSGYLHYEISNYSQHGYECRHNIKYWMREEYIGLGASASSFTDGKRYKNSPDIIEYINSIERGSSSIVEEYTVSEAEGLKEEVFLGLRTTAGISIERVFIPDTLLCSLEESGLIQKTGSRISLTDEGMLVSNRIILELLEYCQISLEGHRS